MALPRLSSRLRAVLAQTRGAATLVDVGTDHALLPLAWLELHPQGQAVGIDCAPCPLQVAQRNRARSRHANRLELVLDHGLGARPIPSETTITICGMGGRKIVEILQSATRLQATDQLRLVLAPQDHAGPLRGALVDLGFALTTEDALWERDQYYPILVAKGPHANPQPLTPWQQRYGPHLLAKAHPALRAYLQKQIGRLSELASAAGHRSPIPAQLADLRALWSRYFGRRLTAPWPDAPIEGP